MGEDVGCRVETRVFFLGMAGGEGMERAAWQWVTEGDIVAEREYRPFLKGAMNNVRGRWGCLVLCTVPWLDECNVAKLGS